MQWLFSVENTEKREEHREEEINPPHAEEQWGFNVLFGVLPSQAF